MLSIKSIIGSCLAVSSIGIASYASYEFLIKDTVEKRLRKENKVLLDFEIISSYSENGNWEGLEKKYRERQDTEINFNIQDFEKNISDDSANSKKLENIKKIQDKCKSSLNDFQTNYDFIKNWCSKESSN